MRRKRRCLCFKGADVRIRLLMVLVLLTLVGCAGGTASPTPAPPTQPITMRSPSLRFATRLRTRSKISTCGQSGMTTQFGLNCFAYSAVTTLSVLTASADLISWSKRSMR